MPLRFTIGDMFAAGTAAIVNTVNCVGVMGKGVALGVRQRYPEIMPEYMAACRSGELQPGSVLLTFAVDGISIFNLATKRHWREPSRMEWVDAGLARLAEMLRETKCPSVAVPPPGCGNGGLNWDDVRPLVQRHLGALDGCDVVVFEP